jgi:hypothetical protein
MGNHRKIMGNPRKIIGNPRKMMGKPRKMMRCGKPLLLQQTIYKIYKFK